MQKIKAVLLLSALLAIMSFMGVPASNGLILKTITYGACGCQNTTENAAKVELTLNPDHTFSYLNASNPAQKVDLKGTWKMSGKKVVLQADTAEQNFHKNWKFDNNQPCVLSRKGLSFIRLCDIESCK